MGEWIHPKIENVNLEDKIIYKFNIMFKILINKYLKTYFLNLNNI